MKKWVPGGIIVLAVLAGVLLMKNSEQGSNSDILRVAFPYAKPARVYEPSRIHLAPEYIFLENTFSSLVELSPENGEIQPGVAEKWAWKENELHLTIRKDLKTIDGITITPQDAEFSLKRLLAMPGNTHGDFKKLICGNSDLKSVADTCEGIRVQGQELVLATNDAGKNFLLPMLTAIDFAIIPRGSVDPKDLTIVDFRNTSGVYYVSKDSESGEIELRANPGHFHFSEDIAKTIILVPSDLQNPRSSFEDFENGKVDLITTIDLARADDVIEFSRSRSDARLHTSQNIRSFVLDFSERGLKELSPRERFSIGKAVREEFAKVFAGKNGYESSSQFFPTFGDGALNSERMAAIDANFRNADTIPATRIRAALVRLGDSSKFANALKSALPQIEVGEQAKNTVFTKFETIEQMPHFTICGPDTGFQEDIGLISYTLNAGYFGMPKEKRKAWIENYMQVRDKTERLSLLRDAHAYALSEPTIIPLLVAPYAALVKKNWDIKLSSLYANNQLWLIKRR